jgi:hypothetical protein
MADRNALLTQLDELETSMEQLDPDDDALGWYAAYSTEAERIRDVLYPGGASDEPEPAPAPTKAPKKSAPVEGVDPRPGLERAALEAQAAFEDVMAAGTAFPKLLPGQKPATAKHKLHLADQKAAGEAWDAAQSALNQHIAAEQLAVMREETIAKRTRRTADERFMAKRTSIAAKLPAGWERDKFLAQNTAPSEQFLKEVRTWVEESYNQEIAAADAKKLPPSAEEFAAMKPKPQIAPDVLEYAERVKGLTDAERHAASRNTL